MMPRSIACAALAALCLCINTPARADGSTPAVSGFVDPSTAVDLSGEVTLENCVAQALSRNFTVKIQQFSVLQSVNAVVIQKAAFEPTLGFNANRQVVQE